MRTKRQYTGALLFAGALALSILTACAKKAGSSCKADESLCLNKTTALVCRAGKFVEVACAGGAGCAKAQSGVACDTSLAKVGDNCVGEGDDEYACSADGKRAVACRNGKFEAYLECRGARGCSVLGHLLNCDTSIAAKDDPCKTQGSVACSEDQKEMLTCHDGRFALYRYCRGQYGCKLKGDSPSCDETYSMEGDPCGLPGQVVCALDRSSELVCQGGAFARSRRCKKGCTVTNRPGRAIDCD